MGRNPFGFLKKPDRVDVNKSDGRRFFGYDDKKSKTTDWYDSDGNLDSSTPTPEDDDDKDDD